jgi:hypothetical protein
MELRKFSEAVRSFEAALNLEPTSVDYKKRLEEARDSHKKNKPKVNSDGVIINSIFFLLSLTTL